MKRRSLFKRLGAVAVAAAIPVPVVAVPACDGCTWLQEHRPIVPEIFEPTAEIEAWAIGAIHKLAVADGLDHQVAAMKLWLEHMPTYQVIPPIESADVYMEGPTPLAIEPMTHIGAPGQFLMVGGTGAGWRDA